jgi:NADPH:quinone reductase-like Zn-dependent oxidoreductase
MKSVRIQLPTNVDSLRLSNDPDPGAPGPGEVLVRIHANSLNFHDFAVVAGFLPTVDGRIPLSDGAGVVQAVGEGVEDLRVGDSVVSCFFPQWIDGPATVSSFATVPGDGVDGYASQQVIRPAAWFTRTPAGYSHLEAATLPTAGVAAWRALVADGALKAGDNVLVMGSGGVSVFALQLAKKMGATVIATSSSDEKLARMAELGADHLINYRQHADWGARAFELTGGRGADHVVEIGGAGTLAQSVNAVSVGGHIAIVGAIAGPAGDPAIHAMLRKQVRVQSLLVGSRRHQLDLIRALEVTGIRPVVDKTFALDDLGSAFKYQLSGGHLGKVCIAS